MISMSPCSLEEISERLLRFFWEFSPIGSFESQHLQWEYWIWKQDEPSYRTLPKGSTHILQLQAK